MQRLYWIGIRQQCDTAAPGKDAQSHVTHERFPAPAHARPRPPGGVPRVPAVSQRPTPHLQGLQELRRTPFVDELGPSQGFLGSDCRGDQRRTVGYSQHLAGGCYPKS
eukprot:s4235_g2.t1